MNLNAWLRKTPQPVAVLADDKRIEVPKNGRAWKDITATIEGLAPSKVVCLDAQGAIIRATALDAVDDDSKATPASEDPLVVFARLLAEGYEKGSKATQPLLDNSLAFIERLSARLSKAETEIERLRGINAKLFAENTLLKNEPAAAPEGEGGILAGIMQGLAAAQTEQPAAGPTPIRKPQEAKK